MAQKQPLTLAEAKARLLNAGKVTQDSLAKVRAELAADPEIKDALQGKSVHVLK